MSTPGAGSTSSNLLFDWGKPASRLPWLLLWLLVAVAGMVLFSIALRIQPPEVSRQSPRPLQVLLLDQNLPAHRRLIERANDGSFPFHRSSEAAVPSHPQTAWPTPTHSPALRQLSGQDAPQLGPLPQPDFLLSLPPIATPHSPSPAPQTTASLSLLTTSQPARRLLTAPRLQAEWVEGLDLASLRYHLAIGAQGRVTTILAENTDSSATPANETLKPILQGLVFEPLKGEAVMELSELQWVIVTLQWQEDNSP